MSRPRPRPRAPFVVTVALAAAAGACGGSTSDDGGQAGSGGGSGGAEGGSGGVGAGGSGGGGFGGGGFGGAVFGGGGCGANPPSIPCPPTPPVEGTACPPNDSCFGGWWGSSCSYADPCGGPTPLVLDCSGATWQVQSGTPTCTTCPPTAPVPGSACSLAAGQSCSYDTCAATGMKTTASCDSSAWSVTGAPCASDAGTD